MHLRHEQMDEAYRTGPIFRGLNQLDENHWLCQVYMFRDQELEIGPIPDEIPVEYLCHTVEITRQDSGAHTIRLLAEAEGEMSGETDLWRDMMEPPPVIWTGSAGGVDVTLYPFQTMIVQGGWVNGMTRGIWNFLNPDWPQDRYPDPDANFGVRYGRVGVDLTNRSEEQVQVELVTHPAWREELELIYRHDNEVYLDEVLGPGETLFWSTGTGGAEHYNSIETKYCLSPDYYTATLTVDGVEYPLILEREVMGQ